MMLWDSYYPQAIKYSTTAQASIFPNITPTEHNHVSLVHTHSLVTVPRSKPIFTYRTIDPSSPYNCQSSPASVTRTVNYIPHNNPPKLVPYVPVEPESDLISSDSSLLDSSYPSESGCLKILRLMYNKLQGERCNN